MLEKKNAASGGQNTIMTSDNNSPSSLTSSAYSVLDNGSGNEQHLSPSSSGQLVVPTTTTTSTTAKDHSKEIDQLKEIVREQEDLISSLQHQLHNEQNQVRKKIIPLFFLLLDKFLVLFEFFGGETKNAVI